MPLSLQTLSDRAELEDLIDRLGRWLDAGAPGDAADLLTDDVAIRTPGGRASGRATVVAQARRNHQVPTQHAITNLQAELDGDEAALRANLLATFVRDDGPQLLRERYSFAARRTGAGWRLHAIATDLVA